MVIWAMDVMDGGFHRARSFLTKEERITLLKEYQDELEKEKEGVAQRIKELEAS